MAHTLADVLLRRTDLAPATNPAGDVIRECAELMARELDWDESRISSEIEGWQGTLAGQRRPTGDSPAAYSQR